MQYPKSVFLLAVVLCTLLLVAEAVDRHKFRTCSNTGFCKRNRKLPDRGLSYQVVGSSLHVDSSHVTADVINTHNNISFSLEIISYNDGILRVKMNEKNPRKPRYEVQDVILDTLHTVALESVQTTDTSLVAHFGGSAAHKHRFHLNFAPLKLDVYVDDILTVSANSKGLLNMEHLREKSALPHVEEPREPEAPTAEDAIHEAEEGVAPAPQVPDDLPVEPLPISREEIAKDDLTDAWEEHFGTYQDSKPNGPSSVSLDFAFAKARHLYGLPEHTTGLSLKTTRGAGISEDEAPYRLYNLDVFEYELGNTMALYGSVPMILALAEGRVSGVLWLNAAETFVDISEDGNEGGKDTHWFSESGIVDAFIMTGPSPQRVFKQYADMTGTVAMPQMFAIAYHQCRWNYKDEADVAQVDANFDAFDIPYDVLWLDIEHTDGKRYFTWDKTHFPNPEHMQQNMKDKGRKMVVIIDPHIKTDSNYYIHSEAHSKDLYIKDKDGKEYDGFCWPGPSSYLDFTDPAVRSWWGSQLAFSAYKGSADNLYVWNDMNEPSVFNGPEVSMKKDAIHHKGWEHRDVHNMYGFYMHMATSDGLVARHPTHNDRSFVLSRAFFAGSQRHGAIWTGDNAAQWSHLAAAQPMLLSLGVAGIAFSGADVGGFFGNPDAELVTRWYQAGAFYPFFRGHAHLDARRREPWLFGEPYTTIIREAIRTRYALLPFWYTAFHENNKTGMPIMRPLWVEFPTDENVLSMDDEFLIGKSILVKPVTNPNQASTSVYLPGTSGEVWYDYATHESHSGGGHANVPTPLERTPVFVRGGAVVPRKDRPRRSSAQMLLDPYTLLVALDKNGEAEGYLYIDDGHSFDYKTGAYHERKFTFKNDKLASQPTSGATCSSCGADALVERVLVIGLGGKVKQAHLQHGGKTTALSTEPHMTSSDTLVVRKPGVRIDQDWEIHFD